jgi:MSHA biogenesis protein MshG
MTIFHYRGRNGQGALIDGELEADGENAVANHLLDRQITPLEIEPVELGSDWLKRLRDNFTGRKVALLDLIFFSRQMYSLQRSGVPILDALAGLRDSTPNPALAKVIGAIRDSLDAGSDLSGALRQHPQVFPALYINIVEIGEATGTLAESFLRLVNYLEQERDTQSRIRTATRYPKLVLSVISIAIFVINLFVIPAFSKLFARFHATLPLPTRILMGVSDFTVAYWYLILLGAVAGIYVLRRYINTPHGRLWWDRTKLKMPVIGGILYRASLGRFAYALAICIKTGVSWSKSMQVVSQAVDNTHLSQKITTMRDGVERGETIALTAAATGLFPPLVLQMIQVGEQTGTIDQQLNEVAQYYEREVDYQLKHLSTSIEPILLGIVGFFVLILALGIFMPMWGLASAALHH